IATRPELNLGDILKCVPRGTFNEKVIESVEINLKYKGYIQRERQQVEKLRRLEDLEIPEGFDFDRISGLTIECRQKFKHYVPRTIGQASRISGVSPADISVLLVYFGR
ncbi:MAG: tRNA uridine-5-carboxymethylaminomethyl(34) synthesis enzyme MnmG, partial [Bacteroidales bacterium]|nr:tRNA uridine-5-carboxymethylaminomethyl(34) synthesis enzyme MnmG [Bacteroidales bacterium]